VLYWDLCYIFIFMESLE